MARVSAAPTVLIRGSLGELSLQKLDKNKVLVQMRTVGEGILGHRLNRHMTDAAGGLDVAATSYLREGRLRWLLTPHPACATAVALATLSPQTGEGAYGF